MKLAFLPRRSPASLRGISVGKAGIVGIETLNQLTVRVNFKKSGVPLPINAGHYTIFGFKAATRLVTAGRMIQSHCADRYAQNKWSG